MRNFFLGKVLFIAAMATLSTRSPGDPIAGESLSITGNSTLGGNLHVTGDSIFAGSLDIEGDAQGTVFTLGTNAVNQTLPAYRIGIEDRYAYLGPWMITAGTGATSGWAWLNSAGYEMASLFQDEGMCYFRVNGSSEIFGDMWVTGHLYVNDQPVLTAQTTNNLTFANTTNHTISIAASASGQGRDLTINAGAGATDSAGGNLILSSGAATGTGGSAIEFKTAANGALETRMAIRSSGGVVAGTDLITSGSPQLVIGKYNNALTDSTGNHAEGLFIIGSGTENERKNTMRVRNDGAILIQPQGDISMGEFGSGERP